jgi:uncharacterized protein YdaU (DUF1376 family)
LNYYEHHLGDWAAATGHLTWDEDMAYTRLLRAYYSQERAIPEGQQYRLAKALTPVQRRAVDQVLIEFFDLRDGHYHQKRADAEIARYLEKEPDREAKKDNERERQRRTREHRKELFELLRGGGVVPRYDAPMSELQALVSRLHPLDVTPPVTRDVTPDMSPVTRDVTPPVTRDATATHSQTPDTIPKEETVSGTPHGDAPTSPKKRTGRAKRLAGEPAPTSAVWSAYSAEYDKRYGTKPVGNAMMNGMLAQFVARLPAEEAPEVARHFVRSNQPLYVAAGHAVNLLLRDAEKLRMEWATGRSVRPIGTAFASERAAQADRIMGSYAAQARAADSPQPSFIDMEAFNATRIAGD